MVASYGYTGCTAIIKLRTVKSRMCQWREQIATLLLVDNKQLRWNVLRNVSVRWPPQKIRRWTLVCTNTNPQCVGSLVDC
jgi:hypothetical protein